MLPIAITILFISMCGSCASSRCFFTAELGTPGTTELCFATAEFGMEVWNFFTVGRSRPLDRGYHGFRSSEPDAVPHTSIDHEPCRRRRQACRRLTILHGCDALRLTQYTSGARGGSEIVNGAGSGGHSIDMSAEVRPTFYLILPFFRTSRTSDASNQACQAPRHQAHQARVACSDLHQKKLWLRLG